MRDKQRLIYKHLLNSRNLLLQTSLHDHVNRYRSTHTHTHVRCACSNSYAHTHSVHPTVYVGHCNGSALYHKWYFEVQVTQLLPTKPSGRSPHLRVGWAHSSLFTPLPASNGSSTTGECMCVCVRTHVEHMHFSSQYFECVSGVLLPMMVPLY